MQVSASTRRETIRSVVPIVALLGLIAATRAWTGSREPQEEFARTFEKTVALAPGQQVRLDHRLGDIAVHTHAQRDVHIVANIRVSAPSREAAANFGNQIAIQVEQTGAGLSVRTDYPDTHKDFFRGHKSISFSVNYDITMPETAPLHIKNSFGNVSVVGLKAEADIENSHGLLTFRDGRGSQRLQNSFGGIELTGNAGDVSVANNNSFVRVAAVEGALSLRNRFGEVTASNIGKQATIVNSNGNVELKQAGGPSAVSNAFGAVNASHISGDLVVHNSNGAVEARGIAR